MQGIHGSFYDRITQCCKLSRLTAVILMGIPSVTAKLSPIPRSLQAMPYYGSVALSNQGMLGDWMLGWKTAKKSLLYSDIQIQPLYTGVDSVFSIGGGYRERVRPWWVAGGHLYLDTRLSHQWSPSFKLMLGASLQTRQGGVSINAYSPCLHTVKEGYLNKVPAYSGNQAYYWAAIEQNQWGGEIHGMVNLHPKFKWYAGFYSIYQENQASVMGGLNALEYSWNPMVSMKLQYNFDTFHQHHVIGSVQVQYKKIARSSGIKTLLWQPINRQTIPLYTTNTKLLPEEYHLFFDSRAEKSQAIEATYEQPYPLLNQSILEQCREHYNTYDITKVVLHLKGYFNVSYEGKTALILNPYEHIQGESCAFDSLSVLGIPFNPSVELYQPLINKEVLNKIGQLNDKAPLVDGRPLLTGSIFLNSHTSVQQLGFLPLEVQVLPGMISTISPPIVAEAKEGKRFKDIAIQDIAIFGRPGASTPFQYEYGIRMKGCDQVKMKAIWINNVETGIYLEDVTQASTFSIDKPLQSIYTGSYRITKNPITISDYKGKLRDIIQSDLSQQNLVSENKMVKLYEAYQGMSRALDSVRVNLQSLFEYISTVDAEKLSNHQISVPADAEPYVLIGMYLKDGGIPDESKTLRNRVIDFTNKILPANYTLASNKIAGVLDIGDAVLMSQGISLVIDNGFYVTLHRCLLETKQLGCYAKDGGFTGVGNPIIQNGIKLPQESFVYINHLRSKKAIREKVDQLPLLKNMKQALRDKLPVVSYIHYVQKNQSTLNTRFVNTGLLLAVSDEYWMLKSKRVTQDAFFLFVNSSFSALFKDNTYTVLHSGKEAGLVRKVKLDEVSDSSSRNGGSHFIGEVQKAGSVRMTHPDDQLPLPVQPIKIVDLKGPSSKSAPSDAFSANKITEPPRREKPNTVITNSLSSKAAIVPNSASKPTMLTDPDDQLPAPIQPRTVRSWQADVEGSAPRTPRPTPMRIQTVPTALGVLVSPPRAAPRHPISLATHLAAQPRPPQHKRAASGGTVQPLSEHQYPRKKFDGGAEIQPLTLGVSNNTEQREVSASMLNRASRSNSAPPKSPEEVRNITALPIVSAPSSNGSHPIHPAYDPTIPFSRNNGMKVAAQPDVSPVAEQDTPTSSSVETTYSTSVHQAGLGQVLRPNGNSQEDKRLEIANVLMDLRQHGNDYTRLDSDQKAVYLRYLQNPRNTLMPTHPAPPK